MRILLTVLVLLLALLQYRLWFGEGGVHDLDQLQTTIEQQTRENEQARQRNDRLRAQVQGLREPGEAIEELAREELGLVAEGEIFYQVVEPAAGVAKEPEEAEMLDDNGAGGL